MFKRIFNRLNHYYRLGLTWVFDKIVDNAWVAKTFPSSLDLAIRLKLVRNGMDVKGRSRLELARLAELPNHTLLESYKLYPIAQEMEAAKKKGGMLKVLSKIMDAPKEYLIDDQDWLMGNHVSLPLFLSECSCVNSGNFNRMKNNRRSNIEDNIIQNALFDLPKTAELDYMGFGSGRLLEDLFIIVKLIKAGYKNITMHLVDPIYQGNVNQSNSIIQFRDILFTLAKQEKIKIGINFYDSIKTYQQSNPNKKIKIATAIDFDDFDKAFDQLTEVFSVLSPQGRFYLAYSIYDLYFDANGCFQLANHGGIRVPDILCQLHQDIKTLSDSINNENHIINIAMFIPSGQDTIHFYYLIPALQNARNKIVLTLFTPKEKGFFGNNTDRINPAYTEENLVKYIKQFLPKEQEIDIKFVKDFAEFKQLCANNQYDMITELFHSSYVEDQHHQDITWLHERFPKATHYYATQYAKKENEDTTVAFDNIWRWDVKTGLTFFHKGKGSERVQEDHSINHSAVAI